MAGSESDGGSVGSARRGGQEGLLAQMRRNEKFGIKKHFPPAAHLALAQLRTTVAGDMAGASDRLCGFGAQLANLAEVPEVAPRTNRDARRQRNPPRDTTGNGNSWRGAAAT